MLWLLLLHISAVICWCGSLLYLPALIAETSSQATIDEPQRHLASTLNVFTLFATPAALTAIVSGTALFLTGGITDLWLILKLTLVAALVLCHALSGWIVLSTEKDPDKNVVLPCVLVGIVVAMLIPAILWVVLTKPF
ncbi:CopD family protein [Methylomarinum sp. Ch1-1]|uniref:Protoporphyrinogen IX oxidase n=1 Tax=Methylomarinum roseum TaxID=3067653 RepID=A0AAU7NSA9_9GAMM|nr:CopD family protein [Methylomarinum sp. Ch1-1]MDP4520187.1 CopD family protein [Methylomarinum sp. Ch1-1]